MYAVPHEVLNALALEVPPAVHEDVMRRAVRLDDAAVERATDAMLDENEKPHTVDTWLRLARAGLEAACRPTEPPSTQEER